MDYFIGIVIGIVVALAGAYFLYVKGLMDEVAAAEDSEKAAMRRMREVMGYIDSAHYAAFGPVGIPQQSKDEAFNKLWMWIGKEGDDLRGIPKG